MGARTDYSVGSFPWGEIGIADLNGDGKLDIAVANSGSNSVSILLGNGDGTFQPPLSFATGNFPHSVAVDPIRIRFIKFPPSFVCNRMLHGFAPFKPDPGLNGASGRELGSRRHRVSFQIRRR